MAGFNFQVAAASFESPVPDVGCAISTRGSDAEKQLDQGLELHLLKDLRYGGKTLAHVRFVAHRRRNKLWGAMLGLVCVLLRVAPQAFSLNFVS